VLIGREDTGVADQSPDDRVTSQPRYHGSDENAAGGSARGPLTARQRWTRMLVIAIVIALFLAMVILHVTGALGPGTNG
jgi:hypothetical protein